jgi:hypothetical protein
MSRLDAAKKATKKQTNKQTNKQKNKQTNKQQIHNVHEATIHNHDL